MPRNHSTLTGAAGEHYVMYRLLKMGYIAALAPKGVPNADLIVTDVEGKVTAVVQVKTKSKKNANGGWHMRAKHEILQSANLYYCFVEDTVVPPVVYVVPSKIVAETISEDCKIWLSTPGRGGRAHKENDIRWFLPDYTKTSKVDNQFTREHADGWLEKYKENWNILNLEKDEKRKAQMRAEKTGRVLTANLNRNVLLEQEQLSPAEKAKIQQAFIEALREAKDEDDK